MKFIPRQFDFIHTVCFCFHESIQCNAFQPNFYEVYLLSHKNLHKEYQACCIFQGESIQNIAMETHTNSIGAAESFKVHKTWKTSV